MKLSSLSCFFIIFLNCVHAQDSDFRITDFRRADSVAHLYPHYSLKDLRALTVKLTTPFKSEEEKFRAIYTWVCLNIANDYPMFLRNREMRKKYKDNPQALEEWNRKMSKGMFKTLLNDYKTACTGYAYLVREMSALAGIDARIVDGYGRSVGVNIGDEATLNHSWNAVRLNGAWYLCDPTWSSGDCNPQTTQFIANYDPSYFLADPELFARNHYPQDTAWMFLKEKPVLQTFLKGPVVYRGAFQHKIKPIEPQRLNIDVSKGGTVTFRFAMPNEVSSDKIVLLVEKAKLKKEIRQIRQGVYEIEHTFKSRGIFDVHLLLDNQFIYTHAVKVH